MACTPKTAFEFPTLLLGAKVEAIDGYREAALVAAGTATSLPLPAESAIFDVGGGSTELIRIGPGSSVTHQQSLNIGSVRLTERFVVSDPPGSDELEKLRARVRAQLQALPPALTSRVSQLIGVAGTITTLFTSHHGIEPYDADQVDGATLSRDDIAAELARYLATLLAERRQIRGLAAGRADVIIAGAVIVEEVMEILGASALHVSDRGVRWGLAAELLRE